jgi:5-(carboxyamino)imidazole ribonucleotide mutase
VTTAEIGIIMGSDSDLPTMAAAVDICEQFKVAHEVAIVSAHRTPERMVSYGQTAHQRGLKVIIAGAGPPPRYGGSPDPPAGDWGSRGQP